MAKTSYGVVARHPVLAVFPALSTLAGGFVLASFVGVAWQTGVFQAQEAGVAPHEDPVLLVELFLYYFASYFGIVFFNVALLCCAERALDGHTPSLGQGFAGAAGRLPAILGWSLVSAVVGVALRWLERASPKLGGLAAGLFGLGWTAVSFFVVPVLAIEGCGPVAALQRSGEVLRERWGEALLGDLSVAWLGILLALPALLLAVVVAMLPGLGDARWPAAIAVGGLGLLVSAAFSSAADTLFKLLLYRQATERSTPDEVDLDAIVGRA